jgi:hypothetical protein
MFTLTFKSALVALLGASAVVNGHMIMKTPKPFGSPNNSPLDASGSDFPCKGGPYDRSSVQNVMAIGEPQTLSFTGSAVHGGGSCQVSLTTDLQPTKDTKWMVIKSIEGGCPASVAGNLPADPNGSGASTFQYSIPDGIAPGEYVIAWTWINKIGNREFYMNCGPATVTAAKKKRYVPNGVSLARRQSSFPDMFVANIASVNDCTTPESFDYDYPNPGADVQSAGTGPYTTLACGAAGGNNPAPKPTGAAGAGGSGSPTGAPATPTGETGTGDAGTDNAGPGNAGSGNAGDGSSPGNAGPGNGGSRTGAPGSFATGSAPLPSGVGSAPDSSVPAPESPAPVESEPAPPASTGSLTPPASGSSTSGACSDEGAWVCLPGGTSYQRCASGSWTPVMPLAAGTQCTPGSPSANFQISRAGASAKRRDVVRRAA